MRPRYAGRLSRTLLLGIAGGIGCSEPNASAPEPDRHPASPVRTAPRLPAGFLELWSGGPVLPDNPRTREMVAAMARPVSPRSASRSGMPGASFAVVQSSTAELLDGEAGSSSEAVDVNRSGVVIGAVLETLPMGTPVTWGPSALTPARLPLLPEWESPRAVAINAAGDIVGDAALPHPSGTHFVRVVRWGADGSLTTLPPEAGRDQTSYIAVDIAPNGDILGETLQPFPPSTGRVLLWHGGVASDIGPANEGAVPIALNAGGLVLATTFSGPAVRTPDGIWKTLASPPGNLTLFATGLADDGTVVGGGFDSETATYHIVRWSPDGTPSVIPPPGPDQQGFASAVNSQGTMLLTIFDAGSSLATAWVLDDGDYSPLPAVPPDGAQDLDLQALSDTYVAIGNWNLNATRQAVRWRVTFPNAAPIPDAGGPYTSQEGSTVAFAGSAFDPTPTGTLSGAWTFGDGGSAAGFAPGHVYVDDGSYTATLSAEDGELAGSDIAQVTVTNVVPALTVPASATAVAGTAWTIEAGFSDAGLADGPWSYRIDWGDGSAPTLGSANVQGAIGAARLYKQAGSFTVAVTVRDKDGGSVAASYPLTVLKRNGRPRS